MDPVVIGMAGGTGSGKTTVAREILKRAGTQLISFIQHDAYYKDLGDLPPAQRAMQNFDHPDALDNDLLIRHLQELKAGRAIAMPVYDFTTHTRTPETRTVQPHRVIILEGILIFADEALRRLMDVKIFVDTDSDIRFIRRLERDIAERGSSWSPANATPTSSSPRADSTRWPWRWSRREFGHCCSPTSDGQGSGLNCTRA